jgi:hypothetical protein
MGRGGGARFRNDDERAEAVAVTGFYASEKH